MLGRLKASVDDPLALESAGFALFDMYPERRGNIFSDEVYRLTKATDATTSYPRNNIDQKVSAQTKTDSNLRFLPPNHKFSSNDVIVLTLQPTGSGDFFSANTVPTSEAAITAQARVLNMGPTYLDVAISAGNFEAAFGPAPNDRSSDDDKVNRNCRLRVDRFFSDVPYQRMVAALGALTSIPDRSSAKPKAVLADNSTSCITQSASPHSNILMDEVLREMILQTSAYINPEILLQHDFDADDLQELVRCRHASPLLSVYS